MMMIAYNNRPKTGVPHVVTDEEHYGGWVFPQGSMIISNLWYIRFPKYNKLSRILTPRSSFFALRAMMKDETNFPSPEIFCPDRYTNNTEIGPAGLRANVDPNDIVYGFGRRYL